ncbi:alpha/beta hydrolase [Vreelandella sedimenti]|uniref:alpha/beta hydrolase n=1 Tax=Vreelandella sedimenti TaxID=2729618 RepID=UPI00257B013F|nr:alpha/beta hydrolase [Halomonas sp. UBA3173]
MTDIHAISHTYGSGTHTAVVMAPVMPTWDQGLFFQPLVSRLVLADFSVITFDTLSLLPQENESLDQFSDRWQKVLLPLGSIDLLAGVALGGAVVQSLLSKSLRAQVAMALLISSPSWADDVLNTRLGHLADLAAKGDLLEALQLLDRLVQPANQIVAHPPQFIDDQTVKLQAERLHRGFSLLFNLDLKGALDAYSAPLLSIYGGVSQLVRKVNVQINEQKNQYLLEIPNGGMRPLIDAPQMVISAVNNHFGLALGELT